MSEARRRRRAMEKALGLKKPINPLSKEGIELSVKKIKAGKEVHRQNLEKNENARIKKSLKKSGISSGDTGISLNIPDFNENLTVLKNSPYNIPDENPGGLNIMGD